MNVILVSKGPSTRKMTKQENYKIACLNDAIVLCDKVDYFFTHDQSIMDIIDTINPNEWTKVKNFIMPYYPQKAFPFGFSEDNGPEAWVDVVSKVNPNCKFHFVALGVHDMNGLKYPDDIPHMGETYSVLQTAATWLGMNGVKNIITCGVGDLEGGYHPMFEYDWISPDISKQGGVWDPAAAEETQLRFHNIARDYGYNIHRLLPDGDTEQLV